MNVVGRVIGLDFDNTLVSYDELFYAIAMERAPVGAGMARTKRAVRDFVRSMPDGENLWRQLQGEVYGLRMRGATFVPGARSFLEDCRCNGVNVRVISHKTAYPAAGQPVDLRVAALAWMRRNGFFEAEGLGLREGDVFFEPTRAAKLARIADCGCTAFVDDLPEVLFDPTFPPNVQRILFDREGHSASVGTAGIIVARTWPEIRALVIGQ